MDPLRRQAVNVLTLFDKESDQLKKIRDEYCKKHSIGGKDRQRLTALTNSVVRWRGRLDFWIKGTLKKPNRKIQPELKNILRLGIYEVVMDNKIPAYAAVDEYVEIAKKTLGTGQSKLTNAILRKAAGFKNFSESDKSILNKWHSFPGWLWGKWTKQFGLEKTITLVDYFNETPKTDIRRNNNLLSHNDLITFCKENNIEIELWDNSETFYKIFYNLSGLRNLIVTGLIRVQDRAAGMVVEYLEPKPGETILDVCAAPGTKSSYIAELLNGKGDFYISDNNSTRMEKFESEYKNVVIDIKDAADDEFPKADAILIDAPCSGTGVIGKKPDIRWRRSMDEIYDFVILQNKILNNMSQFLKPGGRIIYSTCSIEQEENWGVVDAFLKLNEHFYMDMETKNIPGSWLDDRGALAPFPPTSKTDGMFAVKLVNGS